MARNLEMDIECYHLVVAIVAAGIRASNRVACLQDMKMIV